MDGAQPRTIIGLRAVACTGTVGQPRLVYMLTGGEARGYWAFYCRAG